MKDIKYIIKRVIIGVLIAVILMMLKNKSISAEEIGNIYNVNMHNELVQYMAFGPGYTSDLNETYTGFESALPSSPVLANVGKGYVVFSFMYYSSGAYQSVVGGLAIKSGSQLYACEIGNLEPYTDSGIQYKMATAKCYVNLGSNGIERIRATIPYLPKTTGNIKITFSRYMTFIGSPSPQSNQNVVNAITSQSQEQIRLQTQTNSKLDQQIANQQTMIQQQQQANQNVQNINDSINDDNVDAQDSQITDMQNAISSDDSSGLSGIITAPLRMVNNLTLPCQPINLTIPYMNKDLTIQCMSTSVYPKFSGLAIVGIVVNGFLIYRVIASLYYMVKGFKDPENDKVEVMDL